MIATAQDRSAVLRYLAVLATAATALALLPLTSPALAQDPPQDPSDACPLEADDAGFADRDQIPEAHRANVDCAADLDIVAGFGDNTYRPRLQVRRDQMASFIANALEAAGVELPAGEDDTFTDVPATNVHSEAINRLAAAGIVEGAPLDLGPDEYGPALRTRRDQMASFLMRAAGYAFADDVDAFESETQRFTDVPPGNVHFEKVNAAQEQNIAQGVGQNLFAPRQETRRDQMASFVVRLLNFVSVPAGIAIDSPETATVLETVTATATVTDQFGNPVQGVDVDFAATSTATVPPVPPAGDDTTDASGQATFTFTSPETGTVTVTASIDDPGGNFGIDVDPVSVQTQFVAPDPLLDLGIDPATGPAGTTGVTATFTGVLADLEGVETIDIAGECIDDATLDDTDFTLNGDLAFDFDIADPADEGDCVITFTVHYADSTTETYEQTFDVTV